MRKILKNTTTAALIITAFVFFLNLYQGLNWIQNLKMLMVVFAVWWAILFIFVYFLSQIKNRNNGNQKRN